MKIYKYLIETPGSTHIMDHLTDIVSTGLDVIIIHVFGQFMMKKYQKNISKLMPLAQDGNQTNI